MKIDAIPPGMIPHTDDTGPYGYPHGVTHDTRVEVVIRYNGKNFLYSGSAQSFGWQIEPHAPSVPGLQPESAPITHYRMMC